MAFDVSPVPHHELSLKLAAGWDIQAAEITPLLLGHGGETWTFRADDAGNSYFIKLKKAFHEPGIAVSLLLADRGVPAVAPLRSSRGNAWEPIADLNLLVYPLIDGAPIEPDTMTAADWNSLGAALKGVHDTPLSVALREALASDPVFVPWGKDFLPTIGPALANLNDQADPIQRELARIWSQQGAFFEEFFSFVQMQGQIALASSPLFCLCHNDFHTGNILRPAPGVIRLIDWDNPMWKPPERDLMFIEPEYRSQLEKGYGPLNLNEPVMAYLTSDWLLQDMFDCVDRILFSSIAGMEEKRWAIDAGKSILRRMKT